MGGALEWGVDKYLEHKRTDGGQNWTDEDI